MNFWNIWINMFMKPVENSEVTQPNQRQAIKIKSIQIF